MENSCVFCISIAQIIIKIEAISSEMKDYCKQYLASDDSLAQVIIKITENDLENEKKYLNEENGPIYKYTPRNLEISAINRKVADSLLDYDLLLFHASAISINSKAILFSALSGTGKSTHTQYWKQLYGDNAEIINDDKPFIKCDENEILVFGSPWNGKARISSLNSAKVEAICFFNRGDENKIIKISQNEAIPLIFNQIYIPGDKNKMNKVLLLLNKIFKNVRLYSVYCTNSIESAKFISKELFD